MFESYYNPTKVVIGDSKEVLNKYFDDNSNKNILSIYSGNLKSRNRELVEVIENYENVLIYNNIKNNPDVNYLYEVYKDLKDEEIDLIIAIGGGSIIDTAKGISSFKNLKIDSVNDIREIITEERYKSNEDYLPLIAIPTTAGTGSEVTCWATVWDYELEAKYSISYEELYPKESIIDYRLTETVPLDLTLATGLDALSHAMESFWANTNNDISKTFALKSISTIVDSLPKLLKDIENSEYRKEMMIGSLYAGLAFSNTKTTACHSISYPLTMRYDIPHGIAASITLGEVLKLNKDYIKDIDRLLKAFNTSDVKDVYTFINEMYKLANVECNLSSYGVKEEDIKDIVKRSSTKGRMDNNPRDLSKDMIYELLLNIL